MPHTDRPVTSLDLNHTGAHSRFGGTTWGVHHHTQPGHHTTYAVNHGHDDLSKVESDPATGTIYVDKSTHPLDETTVRWIAVTDHHKLARLIWDAKNDITRALAAHGYTSADAIALTITEGGAHHARLTIATADSRYAFRPIIVR